MASVLDTFYILFKSDASEVEKGTKKAKESVDGLESGLAGADKTSISLGKKFNMLASQALGAFATIYSVTQLLSSARGVVEQSTELGVLSDVLGDSASEIVNWGRVIEGVGGTAKAFEGSIRGLGAGMKDAILNTGNDTVKALQQVGVSLLDSEKKMRTVLQVLPLIARDFSKISKEAAFAKGKALGLDDSTIRVLIKGEAAVLALVARQRGMNKVTDDQRDKLMQLNVVWREFKNLVSDTGDAFITDLLPSEKQVREGFKKFAEVIRENRGMILTFLKGAGVLMGALAIASLAMAFPFIVLAAKIAAVSFVIGLLVTDVENYVTGQDSAIGRAEKRWLFFADTLKVVRGLINGLTDSAALFASAWEAIDFSALFGGTIKSGGRLLDKADVRYKEVFGADVAGASAGIKTMARTPLHLVGAETRAGSSGSSRTNSVTINTGDITVETQATDANGIVQDIRNEMENIAGDAVENFDNGIAG